MRSTWKEHYEDLYNVDTKQCVVLYMAVSRTEVKKRRKMFKNGKAVGMFH